MKQDDTGGLKINNRGKEKILLVLLPFWTPQIPPLGISCLKSFLQAHGYDVKTVDLNIEGKVRKIYDKYFDALREYVSEDKRGNFYNIGHEVLQNHLMAHLNYEDEKEYIKLVKVLIFKTFFIDVDDNQVFILNEIVGRFYNWLQEIFLNLLAKEKPAVLGLSVYKGNIPASVFAFKLTREKYPHVKTVMGGAVFAQSLGLGTPSFNYFLEKTRDYIDNIIIGEGEELFLELLEDRLPASQRVYSQEDRNGKVLDLSLVEPADFSDLDLNFYPNMATYASRSCPYQCRFCTETVYWGKYRKKNTKQVVEELKTLYRRHGSQLFLMCDSLLNPVATELAGELINTGISIYWDGYLRIDKEVCNPDTTLLWRHGGFYRARLGVESGSRQVLESMGKKIELQQIKSAVSALANAGIKTTTYWIIGYPGETEEDFQQSLDLVEELRDDIYEAECNPFGYYLTGQVGSGEWAKDNKSIPLYPQDAIDMLVLQTWIMDCEPSRKETYDRISRFVKHCSKLGIANPYSLYDISKADERWQKLHQSAVPPLLEFKNKDSYINENKHVKKMLKARNTIKGAVEFGF
jgi:hypothetical protein